ncbi:MAG: polyprenyl diphosphate synthase [Gammaproteobacteria bacterium]|nr:polyprenyl diphosphate synthase [Gammaproteobacteria bacterium]
MSNDCADRRLPRHVAIIMDGNGRWARARGWPRIAGHRAGIQPVRELVEASSELGIQALTLFAFSSENWRRPPEEVRLLWELIGDVIESELPALNESGVRLRIIGERRRLSFSVQNRLHHAEQLTAANGRLELRIALNYGGRWDIAEAARRLAERVAEGCLAAHEIDEDAVDAELALADVPSVDLMIRTGGENRISNFVLWQLAYAELYFTDTLWPSFTRAEYEQALAWFAGRQRRYGQTGDQLEAAG